MPIRAKRAHVCGSVAEWKTKIQWSEPKLKLFPFCQQSKRLKKNNVRMFCFKAFYLYIYIYTSCSFFIHFQGTSQSLFDQSQSTAVEEEKPVLTESILSAAEWGEGCEVGASRGGNCMGCVCKQGSIHLTCSSRGEAQGANSHPLGPSVAAGSSSTATVWARRCQQNGFLAVCRNADFCYKAQCCWER